MTHAVHVEGGRRRPEAHPGIPGATGTPVLLHIAGRGRKNKVREKPAELPLRQ
jgi:hypothetical protein